MQTLDAVDGLPIDVTQDLRQRAAHLLREYIEQSGEPSAMPTTAWGLADACRSIPTQLAAGRAVLASEPALQVAFILEALDWSLTEIVRLRRWHLLAEVWRVGDLLNLLYRRRQ